MRLAAANGKRDAKNKLLPDNIDAIEKVQRAMSSVKILKRRFVVLPGRARHTRNARPTSRHEVR